MLKDVSHDSDDECRARVDEWCAPLFQKKTPHRFSQSRSSSSFATTPLLPAEAVGHYSVVASMVCTSEVATLFAANQLHSTVLSSAGVILCSAAYGTALRGPERTSALTCPPPSSVPLVFFFKGGLYRRIGQRLTLSQVRNSRAPLLLAAPSTLRPRSFGRRGGRARRGGRPPGGATAARKKLSRAFSREWRERRPRICSARPRGRPPPPGTAAWRPRRRARRRPGPRRRAA